MEKREPAYNFLREFYLFIARAGSLLLHGLSLVRVSRVYSVAVVCGLLIVVPSLAVEHRLNSCGSWA